MSSNRIDDARVSLRPLQRSDASEIAAMCVRNRADIERVSPPRAADLYTEAGQAKRIEGILEEHEQGTRAPWTIRVDGAIAGDIELHGIRRGAVQEANVGYMVDAAVRGSGVATAALRLVVGEAFGELRLHRVDAGAMPSNVGSQRVLEKAGFTRIGVMQRFLFVAGAWRDHVLYEIVGPDFVPTMES
ncbi:MAG TPA: GNAT family protein [Candidatus Dormibacteraeota bacterium]|nr:GNAT family protein [Candidatus Dormibacteraeota bacterium]